MLDFLRFCMILKTGFKQLTLLVLRISGGYPEPYFSGGGRMVVIL